VVSAKRSLFPPTAAIRPSLFRRGKTDYFLSRIGYNKTLSGPLLKERKHLDLSIGPVGRYISTEEFKKEKTL
jgi:hypothetical protein